MLRALLVPVMLAATMAAWLGWPSPAEAQVPTRQWGPNPLLNRPAVSPYLNLMRRDQTPGGNYQTLVLPQLQAMEAAARQQAEIRRLQTQVMQQAQQPTATGPVTTGHPTYFGNYSHFYNLGPSGSVVRRR